MQREVAPGVFLISQRKRTRFAPFSVNVYVIAGENGLVFDGGMGGKKVTDALVRQIRNIEDTLKARGEACHITRVLPSHGHWDHFSGIEGLRKKLGLQVLATPGMKDSIGSKTIYRQNFRKEAQFIDTPDSYVRRWTHALMDALFFWAYSVTFVSGPMEMVDEHTIFEINGESWELLHMPGHCDDDIVLFNRSRGVLLCGDIVLRAVNTWLGPPRSNLEQYLETLEKLMALPGLTLILPAHGSPITDPYKRLNDAANHRRKRTVEVLTLIKQAGSDGVDFETLFTTIYPSLTLKERFIARGWVLLTLQYLIQKNRVNSQTIKAKTRFFLNS